MFTNKFEEVHFTCRSIGVEKDNSVEALTDTLETVLLTASLANDDGMF